MKVKHDKYGECHINIIVSQGCGDHYLLITHKKPNSKLISKIEAVFDVGEIDLDEICKDYDEVIDCIDFDSSRCPIAYIGI